MIPIKQFTLVVRDDQYSRQIAEDIKQKACATGLVYTPDHPEIIIVVGGDGTFLRAVHQFINDLDRVAFIALRSGTLGFYTDYKVSEVDLLVAHLSNVSPVSICKMPLIQATIKNQIYYALNEIRIENNINTLTIDVSVDDQYLEKYRGNGMIVSTSTGSTAYNRSLGGPIVDHRCSTLILTEVAGIHHNAYRSLGSSLVLDASRRIQLKITNFVHNVFGVDHKLIDNLDIKEVEIKFSDKAARILRFNKETFIPRIRNTLVDN